MIFYGLVTWQAQSVEPTGAAFTPIGGASSGPTTTPRTWERPNGTETTAPFSTPSGVA
jgi:hypothetical protein